MAVAGRGGFSLLWLGFAGLIAGLVLVLENTRSIQAHGDRRTQRQHETENEKKSQSMHYLPQKLDFGEDGAWTVDTIMC